MSDGSIVVSKSPYLLHVQNDKTNFLTLLFEKLSPKHR